MAAAGIGVCVVAGAFCAWLGTPLPWMIGPLLAMAVLRFAGLDLVAPPGARPVGQTVIASSLGLYFTPTVVHQVLSHWPLFVVSAMMGFVLAFMGAVLLVRLADTDPRTAFLASVPGGATEMANLGGRCGARVDRLAVAHSLRVLVVVLTIPFALAALGTHGADEYEAVRAPVRWPLLALLLAASALGGFLLKRFGSPNAYMFGPLAVVIALTGSGHEWTSIPTWLTNSAQVLVGCSLGQLFHRDFVRGAPRFVAVVVGSSVLMLVIASLFGWGAAFLASLPIPTVVVATSPGGIAEMCITAKALKLGVPFVTAAHVVRIVLVTGLTATIMGPCTRALARITGARGVS